LDGIVDGLQYSNWSRKIFEDLRAGGVVAVHATAIYWENTRESLSRIAQWNQRFEQFPDLIRKVRTPADLGQAGADGRIAFMLGAQNCSPIEDDIGLVEVFRDLGLLFMQLTYNNQTALAAGCYESDDAGVTRFGRQVISEMNRCGMIIDMSHSAERSTLEAISLSRRPIVISHANPASVHPSIRNKSDKVLQALSASGGFLGLSTYPFHLKGGPECTLLGFAELAAQAVDVMGIDQVGIGSDLCLDQPTSILTWMRNGRWAKEMDFGEGSADNAAWPPPLTWLKSGRDFPNIRQGLLDFGFSPADAQKIMGANWMRFLEAGLKPE